MALTARRLWRFAAATLILGLCAAQTGAVTPEDGRRAYDARHFTDAMGIWSDLSRQGNTEAEFGLGLLYDLGNGVPENPALAFGFYKIAAEAGLPAAEFNVGAMYDSGHGVAQSARDAALWYAKAAARGHHRAQFDLGLLYEKGDGVPRNPAAAAVWFQDAADGGLSAAASRAKALQAGAPKQSAGPVVGATLVSPPRDADLAVKNDNPIVELVWNAPAEPQPVHYLVRVHQVNDPDLVPVAEASVTQTAVLVRLPAKAEFYVWNVDTIGQDGSHAAGDPSWFSVGTPDGSERSVASVPGMSEPVR